MDMNSDMAANVYRQYVDDTIERFRTFSPFIAIGEACLMFLDYQSGFFAKTPLNHLNLLAEVILIVSSLLMFLYCRHIR